MGPGFIQEPSGGANYAFILPQQNANLGAYRTRRIGGTGAHRFSFTVPPNFKEVVKLVLIYSPLAGAAGTDRDIEATSEYALDGEAIAENSEFAALNFDLTGLDGQWNEFDLTPVFSSLEPRHRCGLFWDHKGIGGTVHYLGIEFEWK